MNSFQNAMSFGMICNTTYYSIDSTGKYIGEYDASWNFLNTTSLHAPQFMISHTNSTVKRLYVSSTSQLTVLDETMDILNVIIYQQAMGFAGLYYNTTSDYLLVAINTAPKIQVYSNSLTFIKSIVLPNPNNNIVEYNGMLYVSSTTSLIMVLLKETFIYSFSISCSVIKTIAIDLYGLIAANCYGSQTNYILLYNTNGTYTGISWLSPVPYVNSIGFDGTGNFIIAASFGLFIFTPNSRSTSIRNLNSLSVADTCVMKGMIYFLIMKK